jgi:hypothetical protein
MDVEDLKGLSYLIYFPIYREVSVSFIALRRGHFDDSDEVNLQLIRSDSTINNEKGMASIKQILYKVLVEFSSVKPTLGRPRRG